MCHGCWGLAQAMEPSDCGQKRFYPLNALGIELANKNAVNCCKNNQLHLKKARTV